jgi:dolichol kinase
MHVSLSLSLVYYVIPDPVPFLGVPKPVGVLALAAIVSAAEAWRLHSGWTLFLFRDYESRRPAGYYWLGLGCCLALVFFPPRFAIITIPGVCIVDPIIGTLRATRFKPWASAVGFALWLLLATATVFAAGLPVPLVLLPLAAAVAVGAEATRLPYLDDDLSMNLAPLCFLTAAAFALSM